MARVEKNMDRAVQHLNRAQELLDMGRRQSLMRHIQRAHGLLGFGAKKTIKVATFNLYAGKGKDMIKTLNEELRAHETDLVVFQEAPVDRFDINGYTIVQWGGPSDHDMMGAALSNSSEWEFESCKLFRTEQGMCKTRRDVVGITLRLKGLKSYKVKIGNVHLCGGRFDDEFHHSMTSDKLTEIKTESVKKLVLEYGADIVLGDFNSDVYNYLNKETSHHQEYYFREKNWNDDQITTWNTAPFKYLEGNGFKLVELRQRTSMYGGVLDVIWYKEAKCTLGNNGVIWMIGSTWSDHNGVFAEFTFNETPAEPTNLIPLIPVKPTNISAAPTHFDMLASSGRGCI